MWRTKKLSLESGLFRDMRIFVFLNAFGGSQMKKCFVGLDFYCSLMRLLSLGEQVPIAGGADKRGRGFQRNPFQFVPI